MEQATPDKGDKPSTRISNQHAAVENAWKIPISTVTATYPEDILLRYVVAPMALNALRTLMSLFALLAIHYQTCRKFWHTDDRVCSTHTHYLLFAAECGLVVLMAYTYFLKLGVVEKRQQAVANQKDPKR